MSDDTRFCISFYFPFFKTWDWIYLQEIYFWPSKKPRKRLDIFASTLSIDILKDILSININIKNIPAQYSVNFNEMEFSKIHALLMEKIIPYSY